LGPYRIVAELGSGGMGTVYRAETADGAVVALKVLHSHLVGKPSFRARFRREVETGRRIRARNVVSTLDAGEAELGGKPALYLAMELVDGQTLRELLDELGQVPEDLCLHIAQEVAEALVAIHGADVVHRDLKPENILITPDNEVRVMDLGVAAVADESLRLSQTGAFVGSVLYAAPEQFDEQKADARADLYTLGLVLYELATGQHPFRTDDVAVVIQRQMRAKPRPPAELNPQLSPFFEELVMMLLAKDRAERLAGAAELLTVLAEGEASAWWRVRARAIRSETARPLRRIRIPRETGVYGREGELALLHRLYASAADGNGQVIHVDGEAGIGKTRLVDEFVERLRRDGEDPNFLFGSYPPGGAATASGAFSTAYREHFGSESLTQRLGEYLRETPALVPAFAALLRGAPPPNDTPLSRESFLSVFVHATRALAAERTTIVVIEDLHLAPEPGRAIFAALAAAAANQRLVLIGTARPGLPAEWVSALDRLDHFTRMPLRRLTPKELSDLLIEALRSQELAAELGWRIATKSDGNPFFVFELVRSLREGRLIAQAADGTWVRTQVIHDIEVPSSVLDLIDARIADLDPEDKDMLEVASCCGFGFDPLLVARALQMPQIPAMKRLAGLEKRHRLVRAVGRRYVFDHHQVQEALYQRMPVLLREPYHAALGDALEERAPKDGSAAVELCEHFLKGAQGERALPYLDAALDHLVGGYLHDSAIEIMDRALAVPDLLIGEGRATYLLRKSLSLEMRGRHDEDRATLKEAFDLSEDSGDAALRCEVRTALGRLDIWTSQYDSARERFTEALEFAREAGDPALEANATGNLGITFYRVLRFDEARALFARGLAISQDLGDRRSMAKSTVNLGNVYWCLGQFDEARTSYERYRDLSREIGYREGEALAAGNLGNVAFAVGRLDAACEHYREVLAMARDTGDCHKETLFTASLGAAMVELGRFDEARELLNRALEMARASGMPREEGGALQTLARLAEEEGDYEGTRRLLEAKGNIRSGEVEGRVNDRVTLARLDMAEGNKEQAAERLDAAIAACRAEADRSQEVIARTMRATLPGGDAAAAAALFASRESRMTWFERMIARYWLWEATGNDAHLDAARRLLESLRGNAPPEDRDSLVEKVRLYRRLSG